MIKETYDDYNNKKIESCKRILKKNGITDEGNIYEKSDADLLEIFEKVKLIKNGEHSISEIDDYSRVLFKFGLGIGIMNGRLNIIYNYINGNLSQEKINEVNPENMVKYNFE